MVQTVRFADDSTQSTHDIMAQVITSAATPGNDLIHGSVLIDTPIGKPGDDTLVGDAGSDTYVWHRGHGATAIIDTLLCGGNQSDTPELHSVTADALVWNKVLRRL